MWGWAEAEGEDLGQRLGEKRPPGRRAQSGDRAECLAGVMGGGLSRGHCVLVRMRPRGLGSGGARVPCDPLGGVRTPVLQGSSRPYSLGTSALVSTHFQPWEYYCSSSSIKSINLLTTSCKTGIALDISPAFSALIHSTVP